MGNAAISRSSRSHILVAAGAGAAIAAAALAGCGSSATPQQPSRGAAGAQADAAQASACVPFPASDIPPNPTPPYSPKYGDPQQPASLQALRAAVLATADGSDFPRSGTACAEGQNQEAVCDVDYWNIGGLPGQEQNCNFLYMRVDNKYWTALTPEILNEYHGYLGVGPDGVDPTNQQAGPHVTMVQYGGGWVNIGGKGQSVATLPLTDGKFTADGVAAALQAAIAGPAVGGTGTISPILAADAMEVSCNPVWLDAKTSWNQTTVDTIAPNSGASFACSATGPGVGTAYVEAKLAAPAASGVPAAVSVKVPSDQSNTLRMNPDGGFVASNVVWPVATDEVRTGAVFDYTISSQPVCATDTGKGTESCLHLWVNFPRNTSQSVGSTFTDAAQEQASAAVGSEGSSAALEATANTQACKIWFTLEVDAPGIRQMLAKYGLNPNAETQHISLAKKTWNTNEVGPPSGTAAGKPDPCTDARNLALGQPGNDPFVPNP